MTNEQLVSTKQGLRRPLISSTVFFFPACREELERFRRSQQTTGPIFNARFRRNTAQEKKKYRLVRLIIKAGKYQGPIEEVCVLFVVISKSSFQVCFSCDCVLVLVR